MGVKSVKESSGNQEQKTVVAKDPTHKGPKDSTVASLLREITQNKKTGFSIEQSYSDEPIYHIRLDGDGEEQKQFGEKCILCNKDLSCSPNDVVRADDEFKYRVKFIPQFLPAVDVLPCGHAIHTECSKYAMSEGSNVPQCVFCLSMT